MSDDEPDASELTSEKAIESQRIAMSPAKQISKGAKASLKHFLGKLGPSGGRNLTDYGTIISTAILWLCIGNIWLAPKPLKDLTILVIGMIAVSLDPLILLGVSRVGGWYISKESKTVELQIHHRPAGVEQTDTVWQICNFEERVERNIPTPIEKKALAKMVKLHGSLHDEIYEMTSEYESQTKADDGYVLWRLMFKFKQWCPITGSFVKSIILKTGSKYVGVSALLPKSKEKQKWAIKGFTVNAMPYVGALVCDGQVFPDTNELMCVSAQGATLEKSNYSITKADVTIVDETYSRRLVGEIMRTAQLYLQEHERAMRYASSKFSGYDTPPKGGIQPASTAKTPLAIDKAKLKLIIGIVAMISMIIVFVALAISLAPH